jgi:tetratricopeptide (TPR) repeat protein
MVAGVGAARYAAFISYSHKDAAAARALHARLERYRVPRRLVGTPGDHGPVPARLTPIFRDRDELPAAGDLSEKVRAALAVSDSLVVVCSPDAATSIWVAREIAAFRELNPGKPILAAVIAGEPGECFPEELAGIDEQGLAIEPLAADLRTAGDGRRLGFLKLVAGLTGVGLDALIQRDAARAIRRVTAVTLTALAATLVMAVLTVIALNARKEAERQRGEAEGLVEFMLTDLRSELRGVGRLEVLGIVNKRALNYYDAEGPGTLADASLLRRARILHAIGQDELDAGRVDAAAARFEEAHRATGAALARNPDDAAAIFTHAQGEFWLGQIGERRGDWTRAAAHYARYGAAGERLIAIDPGNHAYMMERAWGPLNRGMAELSGLKRPEAAEKSFRDAIGWFETALRKRPGDPATLGELANAYGWLADSLLARNQQAESLNARRRQYDIAKTLLAGQPDNAQRLYDLIRAERSVGVVLLRIGKPGEAAPYLREARRRTATLVDHDPANARWARMRGLIACDIAALPLAPPDRSGSPPLSAQKPCAAVQASQ